MTLHARTESLAYSLSVAIAAFMLAAPAANAQLTSPVPVGTNYLYSVAGVMNSGGLGTYFDCTSTSTATQNVTVEVFDETGTASGSGTLAVGAGTGVRFGTQPATGLSINSNLSSGLVNGGGAARILSTDKKLVCHAFISSTGGPTTIAPLTIVKKLKQKASN